MQAHALSFGFISSSIQVGSKSNPLVFNEPAAVKADSVRVFGVEDDPLLRMLLSTKFEMSSVNLELSSQP